MADNKLPVDRTGETERVIQVEIKPDYRADANKQGQWFVWRRVSASGWATHCRCDSQDDAMAMAVQLNTPDDSSRVSV